jgi:plastocyanin
LLASRDPPTNGDDVRAPKRIAAALAVAFLFSLAAPAQAATTHDVEIRNFQFSPTPITIQAGDSVRWTNRDGIGHTATKFFDPSGWSTPLLERDQSAEVLFDQPGTYSYYCQPHGSSMTGVINVLEAPDPVVAEVPYVALLSAAAMVVIVAWALVKRLRRVNFV